MGGSVPGVPGSAVEDQNSPQATRKAKRSQRQVDVCDLAIMSREDYLRITGSTKQSVQTALSTPPKQRTDEDMKLLHALFGECTFFRSLNSHLMIDKCCRCKFISHLSLDSLDKDNSCASYIYLVWATAEHIKIRLIPGLQLQEAERGRTLFRSGETGEKFYILVSGSIKGTVRETDQPFTLTAGDSFGELSITAEAGICGSKPCNLKCYARPC